VSQRAAIRTLRSDLEPGAVVNPGTAVLKIADLRSAWVTVHVDERESGPLRAGDAAGIAVRSQPGTTLPGRVARVRRESDQVTEQLAVDLTFIAPPDRLTLGEQAEATIRPTGRRDAVTMPLAALVRTPAGSGAAVVEASRLRLRPVKTGLTDGREWIEVLEGLRPGERVVLAPGKLAEPASEGRRVSARLDRRSLAVARR
jgi:hypothetical protein